MKWQLLGFNSYPLFDDPISMDTIGLFVGHQKEIMHCENTLQGENACIVIEGPKGVGKTSTANYLKFSAQKKKLYLAPRQEINVEPHWNLESLLTVVIAVIVRELEIVHEDAVKGDKVFKEAKALIHKLSEAYNNFGLIAFLFEEDRRQTSIITQPVFISAVKLKAHLQDLGKLATKLGYKNGILIQLDNLDINDPYSEDHLIYLFNAIKDYLQIENISWLLVGDAGLRSFIAKKTNQLDTVISTDVFIRPFSKTYYHEVINMRLRHYETKKGTEFPLNQETFDYLYEATEGQLRYVFGLVYDLTQCLQAGKLLQTISATLAKDAVIALTNERVNKFGLSEDEKALLKVIVRNGELNVGELSKFSNRNRVFVSRTINRLLKDKLVNVRHAGNKRIYSPALDVKLAFSKDI